MEMLNVPMIDSSVVALFQQQSFPQKDTTVKRMETFLKHNFEVTTLALRAVSANSIMARAAYLCAGEMFTLSKLSKKTKSAAAFAADSSLETLQLPVPCLLM